MGLGSMHVWETTAMWAGGMDCKETQADPHSLFGLQMSLDTSLPVEHFHCVAPT